MSQKLGKNGRHACGIMNIVEETQPTQPIYNELGNSISEKYKHIMTGLLKIKQICEAIETPISTVIN